MEQDDAPVSVRASWVASGEIGFPRMLTAIESAVRMVRLEMYMVRTSAIAEEFLAALLAAMKRGVHVRVLLDALGSGGLAEVFWRPLLDAGGEVRFFNPWGSRFYLVRDHRKLLVCDEDVAFVVGYNLAPEYEGDGIEVGWRDVGVELHGENLGILARKFDYQFLSAGDRLSRMIRFRQRNDEAEVALGAGIGLFSVGPGRGTGCFLRALMEEVNRSRDITLVVPYFLPPSRLRRILRRASRRGARIRLVLSARSDVPLAQLAARRLYSGLLSAGIEIWEYEPQILHAKLYLFDDVVFVGSSNLDIRSLHLNHELMVRMTTTEILDRARADVEDIVGKSRKVDATAWRISRSWGERFRERLAYMFLSRIDPWLTWRLLAKSYG